MLLYRLLTSSKTVTPSGNRKRTTGSPYFGLRNAKRGSGAIPIDRRARASAASVNRRLVIFSGMRVFQALYDLNHRYTTTGVDNPLGPAA